MMSINDDDRLARTGAGSVDVILLVILPTEVILLVILLAGTGAGSVDVILLVILPTEVILLVILPTEVILLVILLAGAIVKLAKGTKILDSFIVPWSNVPLITPVGLVEFNNATRT